MKKDDLDFQRAYKFAFDEIFHMLRTDLDRIFTIGTRRDKNESDGGLNLSACALVLIGIEAIARFHKFEKDDAKCVENFVDDFFPFNYKGKFRKIFLDFRHGLLHHFYPKSVHGIAKVSFLVNKDTSVWDIKELEKTGTIPLHQTFDIESDGTIHVVPQALYVDFLRAVDRFKKKLDEDEQDVYRKKFYENYKKVKKILGHKP